MTAVVGLLNKKGVALAADSAVTWTYNNKVTKNGNKMIRLSDVVPTSVMLTGNGGFLGTTWDIIVRHYRQHRGHIKHETVEACMHDFFRYIADHGLFNEPDASLQFAREELNYIFQLIEGQIDFKYKKRGNDGLIASPRAYQKAFTNILNRFCKEWTKDGISPQFQDYSQQVFNEYTKDVFDDYIEEKSYEEDLPFNYGNYPRSLLLELREPLEKALMTRLTTRRSDDDARAELVFSGYGEKQKYPSLVSVIVCEGFDNRVNYHVRPEDVICISDQHPVAICRFAQKDVIRSVLCGMHRMYSKQLQEAIDDCFTPWGNPIFTPDPDDDIDFFDFSQKLAEVKTKDLERSFYRETNRLLDRNQHKWEEALQNYDLQSMAALAESLIDLTGFHRILTFQHEGVGGPVDVAVISKSDGFVWLNRKSWYHHKDVGGQYGKLGV